MATGKRVQLDERDGIVGKECTKCEEWKSLLEFHKDKKGTGGVSPSCKCCHRIRVNKYNEKHREELKEYSRKWREANPDKLSEYAIECKERKAKYAKRYYKENKEKIKEYIRSYSEKNRDRINIYQGKWRKENPEAWAAIRHRHRARESFLPDNFEEVEVVEVMCFFEGCALTGSTENLEWDHAIPLSIGHGGTFKGNMYPISMKLNRSKHLHNIFEWFESNRQRFELSQERFDKLIEWLASANAMTVEEYRDHVYWCHANPRNIDEIKTEGGTAS